jgi:hypothetical protein
MPSDSNTTDLLKDQIEKLSSARNRIDYLGDVIQRMEKVLNDPPSKIMLTFGNVIQIWIGFDEHKYLLENEINESKRRLEEARECAARLLR